MGHLINPISTRLSFTSFWLSSWTDFFSKGFSYNLMLDKGLAAIVDWVFVHSWFAQSLTKNGIFLSHYRILRRGLKFKVHCFLIYNSSVLLKSSFVESTFSTLGTESSELLIKKSLSNKKLSNPLKLSFLKNLKKIKNSKVLGRFESLFAASTSFQSSSNLSRRATKKEIINKNFLYLIRLKKNYLDLIITSLGFYFSQLLSILFTSFWFKLKGVNSNKSTITVGVRFLDNFNIINPQFIARFIAKRVTYGFQLQRVIKPLIKDLLLAVSKKKNKIIGFRIACSGRFDRKQIASYIWQKFGPVPLNEFSSNINYGFSTAFLKYGTCGIKVWIASKHKIIKSQRAGSVFKSEFFKKLNLLSKGTLTNLKSPKTINKLVVVFNSFSLFEKKLTDSFSLKELTALNLNSFLRLQLLSLTWLRYENSLLKKN